MGFQCTECGHTFSQANCLCEDHNDSERAFGCPNCGTFFMRDESDQEGKEAVKHAALVGGIMMPTALTLGNTIHTQEPASLFLVLLTLVSVFFLLIDPKLSFLQKWKKSGYQIKIEKAETGQAQDT